MGWQELEWDGIFILKFFYVLYISCPKMTSNDLIGSNIWRHFQLWKMKTKPIFSVKVKSHSSSCHPIFSIEFHSSRSMLCRFILFQSVALTIDDIVKDFARIRYMISNPYIVCYICSSRMRVLGDKEPVFKLPRFLHWTNYTAVRERMKWWGKPV